MTPATELPPHTKAEDLIRKGDEDGPHRRTFYEIDTLYDDEGEELPFVMHKKISVLVRPRADGAEGFDVINVLSKRQIIAPPSARPWSG